MRDLQTNIEANFTSLFVKIIRVVSQSSIPEADVIVAVGDSVQGSPS